MECVIDTSSLSWMERIERLDLLTQLYTRIYSPPKVYTELVPYFPTKDFVESHIKAITFREEKDRKRFERMVRRWCKKVNLEDIADVEVFIGYRFFTEADEALYANKNAEERLSQFGNVRDISSLYELAEQKGIFTRADSIKFLESFLNLKKPYRTPHIKKLMLKLKSY